MQTNDFCNPPSPSKPPPAPITSVDKSNTVANSTLDQRNANDIEITAAGTDVASDTKKSTSDIAIDDTAVAVIKQPKTTNDNGNNYVKRNELIGAKKSATDIWYKFKHFIHRMCFCKNMHSLQT